MSHSRCRAFIRLLQSSPFDTSNAATQHHSLFPIPCSRP